MVHRGARKLPAFWRSWTASRVLCRCLRPTTIYAGGIACALRAGAPNTKAMAHITGGGITENPNRALPAHSDAEVDRGERLGPVRRSILPVISYVSNAVQTCLLTSNIALNMGVVL